MKSPNHRSAPELSPDERLSALARILAQGFLRIVPTRLERLRAAADKNTNSFLKGTYSLEAGAQQSVHAQR